MENYGHESLGTQIDGMNFQTRSRACLKKLSVRFFKQAQVFREFFNSIMPDLTAAFLLSVFLQTAHRNLCPLHMFSYKNDSPHINSDF